MEGCALQESWLFISNLRIQKILGDEFEVEILLKTPRGVTFWVVENLCWAPFGQGPTYTAECARCLAAFNTEVYYCILTAYCFCMFVNKHIIFFYNHPGVNRPRNWSISKKTLNLKHWNCTILFSAGWQHEFIWILHMHTWHTWTYMSCMTCMHVYAFVYGMLFCSSVSTSCRDLSSLFPSEVVWCALWVSHLWSLVLLETGTVTVVNSTMTMNTWRLNLIAIGKIS